MNKSLKPERQDMKISKIFLFTAAALALCGACDDSDDKVDPSTTEDKISVSPMEGVVGSKGGDVSARRAHPAFPPRR